MEAKLQTVLLAPHLNHNIIVAFAGAVFFANAFSGTIIWNKYSLQFHVEPDKSADLKYISDKHHIVTEIVISAQVFAMTLSSLAML